MPRTTQTAIHLRAGPLAESDVVVRRAVGRESLSGLYAFDLDFAPADGEPLPLSELAAAEALLTLRRPDGVERLVHGMLWSAELVEVQSGKPRYRARLVPRLERLRHVRRSRVFQGKSVPEIVRQVLGEGGVENRDALTGSHPAREYCVQYRESDLAFVERLLEDEGIFYWFEHAQSAHTMVLADSAQGCAALPGEPAVPFRVAAQVGDASEDEHLFLLQLLRRARAGKVDLRDFDFERPALGVAASSKAADDALGLEHYEYPGGFTDPSEGAPIARVRLEELRFGAENLEGEGTCLRFHPGAIFEATEHPQADLDRKLLLVRVEHEASQQEGPGSVESMQHGYRNAFLALDAGVAYRPRRRTPSPVACAETATVVGPAGEEIHTDAHGRVRVQFHWDREGRRDEGSSCWVRVAQAWAGAGWGASFVPRIGQEVFVRFVDGDPDCPLVMGALYNGAHRPPASLPGEKTQSTLLSDSSLGGGGKNELRFEDQKDGELVSVHAQKDHAIEVLHDKQQRIGNSEALEVGNDRSREVGGNQDLRVVKDDGSSIDGKQSIRTGGDRAASVRGSHSEDIDVLQSIQVGGVRKVSVHEGMSDDVGAAGSLAVGGVLFIKTDDDLQLSAGSFTGQVGGNRKEKVADAREEKVSGDSVAQIGGAYATKVSGSGELVSAGGHADAVTGKAAFAAKDKAELTAKEGQLKASDKLSIEVGSSRLVFDTEGICIEAATITFEATSKLSYKGAEISVKGG